MSIERLTQGERGGKVWHAAVMSLRIKTGCSMSDCVKAVDYAGDDKDLAMAYLKARRFAVATPGLTFDERVQRFLQAEGKAKDE